MRHHTTTPQEPSTDWQEAIAPDEEARFAGYARQFAELQQRKSAKYGQGRALHRKQLVAAHAELEVLGALPEFARHGLFASPGVYRAEVRLSNGGMDRAVDSQPDIRGFALAVLGVNGPSALGHAPATRQCFALINHSEFAFPNSAEFVDFVMAAARGPGALFKFLGRRHGWLSVPKQLATLARTVGKPFRSFATETFFSAAPLACGPYAVRVRLVPSLANSGPGSINSDQPKTVDWSADMSTRLAAGPLVYDLELQPFVNEATTPIENASVPWPTPYTAVARLTLPQQDLSGGFAQALAKEVEAGVFDPWAALAAHRPLGDVMRARKVVYFASQQGRGAA